jgi:hypothetical protein
MNLLTYSWGLQKDVLMNDLNLTFPSFPLGTHQIPWNLRILLFKDAATIPRKKAMSLIDDGAFGEPIEERFPLVIAFHEAISSMISLGKSRALIGSSLEVLWHFLAFINSSVHALYMCTKIMASEIQLWFNES